MPQYDLHFDPLSAQDALRDIIALIDSTNADAVSERFQETFKSPHHAIRANLDDLACLANDKTARLLKLVGTLVDHLAAEKIHDCRDILSSWSALTAFLNTTLRGVQIEKFLCLYLDRKNRLIRIVETTGTINRCPVYPREVIKDALLLNATAIILAHQHPSGDPAPSNADIEMTQKIIACAQPMGIAVHDHVIVGDNVIVSFKQMGLI